MRYAVDAGALLRILAEELDVPREHQLVAPTLVRSHVLTRLYAAVRAGELDPAAARRRLERFNGLKVRYLGDRVSRQLAWELAERLGWDETYGAEYLAVAKLQADALVAEDDELVRAADGIVPTAPFEALRRA